MTTVGARGPYGKTAGVRRQILKAGMGVFAENGFHAGTLHEVAARAGLSQRGLSHHFETKEELLLEALRAHDAVSADQLTGRSGLDVLLVNLRLVVEKQGNGLVGVHTLLGAEATVQDHPAHEYYQERYHSFRGHITAVFEALQAHGQLSSSASAAHLAAMFIALLDGLHTQWLYEGDAIDIDLVVRSFLNTALRNPLPQQPTP